MVIIIVHAVVDVGIMMILTVVIVTIAAAIRAVMTMMIVVEDSHVQMFIAGADNKMKNS